jgi:hypothetical protein
MRPADERQVIPLTRMVDYRREKRLAAIAIAFTMTMQRLDAILRSLQEEKHDGRQA